MYATVPQVAALLRVSKPTVRNMIKTGKLRAVQLDGPRTTRVLISSIPAPEEDRAAVAEAMLKAQKAQEAGVLV